MHEWLPPSRPSVLHEDMTAPLPQRWRLYDSEDIAAPVPCKGPACNDQGASAVMRSWGAPPPRRPARRSIGGQAMRIPSQSQSTVLQATPHTTVAKCAQQGIALSLDLSDGLREQARSTGGHRIIHPSSGAPAPPAAPVQHNADTHVEEAIRLLEDRDPSIDDAANFSDFSSGLVSEPVMIAQQSAACANLGEAGPASWHDQRVHAHQDANRLGPNGTYSLPAKHKSHPPQVLPKASSPGKTEELFGMLSRPDSESIAKSRVKGGEHAGLPAAMDSERTAKSFSTPSQQQVAGEEELHQTAEEQVLTMPSHGFPATADRTLEHSCLTGCSGTDAGLDARHRCSAEGSGPSGKLPLQTSDSSRPQEQVAEKLALDSKDGSGARDLPCRAAYIPGLPQAKTPTALRMTKAKTNSPRKGLLPCDMQTEGDQSSQVASRLDPASVLTVCFDSRCSSPAGSACSVAPAQPAAAIEEAAASRWASQLALSQPGPDEPASKLAALSPSHLATACEHVGAESAGQTPGGSSFTEASGEAGCQETQTSARLSMPTVLRTCDLDLEGGHNMALRVPLHSKEADSGRDSVSGVRSTFSRVQLPGPSGAHPLPMDVTRTAASLQAVFSTATSNWKVCLASKH